MDDNWDWPKTRFLTTHISWWGARPSQVIPPPTPEGSGLALLALGALGLLCRRPRAQRRRA